MKKTSFHAEHLALEAKMAEFAGYDMPISYSGIKEEHHAVRENAGLFDVSHMGEFYLKGEGAEAMIQKLSSNDVSILKSGDAQYSCMPNEKGGIVDDLLIYKIADDEFMLVVNAANMKKDWDWISKFKTDNVQMDDWSDKICLLALQGPKAEAILQSLTETKLDEIGYYTFQVGDVAGVENVIIAATGYTGERGFELYADAEKGKALWPALMKAGEAHGLVPAGLASRDTLRLEMGYALYGNDINDDTSPLEAGLAWLTKLDTEFTAVDILRKQKEEKPQVRLVGFEIKDRGIPRKDYEVVNAEGEKIGHVTSGTYSPSLEKGIGLAYVKRAYMKTGTEIFIQVRNRTLAAQVCRPPFYKNGSLKK